MLRAKCRMQMNSIHGLQPHIKAPLFFGYRFMIHLHQFFADDSGINVFGYENVVIPEVCCPVCEQRLWREYKIRGSAGDQEVKLQMRIDWYVIHDARNGQVVYRSSP